MPPPPPPPPPGAAKQPPQRQGSVLRRSSTGFKLSEDGLIAFEVRKINGAKMSVHEKGGAKIGRLHGPEAAVKSLEEVGVKHPEGV